MVVGHSMGGMLAARFATQYPKAVERLVIYNPIGLTDGRFERPMHADRRVLSADAQDRLPEHPGRPQPLRGAQPERVERGVRDVHAHPLLVDAQRRLAAAGDGAGADRPDALRRPGRLRLGAHPGADAGVRRRRGHAARPGDEIPGADEVPRQEHPQRQRPLLLLPGLGHVPHLEAPDKVLPPLVAFLKESATTGSQGR